MVSRNDWYVTLNPRVAMAGCLGEKLRFGAADLGGINWTSLRIEAADGASEWIFDVSRIEC